MKDREAILRVLAFLLMDYDTEYKGDMDDFLNKTMRRINKMAKNEIVKLEGRFKRVMENTFRTFGENNFRLPTENSRGRINIAMMEAICFIFDRIPDELTLRSKQILVRNFNTRLLADDRFREAIRLSTNSEKNVRTRFDMTTELLLQS